MTEMLPVGSVELCAQAFGERGDPAILLIGGSSSSMDWWETDFCEQLAAAGRRGWDTVIPAVLRVCDG